MFRHCFKAAEMLHSSALRPQNDMNIIIFDRNFFSENGPGFCGYYQQNQP